MLMLQTIFLNSVAQVEHAGLLLSAQRLEHTLALGRNQRPIIPGTRGSSGSHEGAGVSYLPPFLLELFSSELQKYSRAQRDFEHGYVGQWLGGRGREKAASIIAVTFTRGKEEVSALPAHHFPHSCNTTG